jgi:hypothetical protein
MVSSSLRLNKVSGHGFPLEVVLETRLFAQLPEQPPEGC